MLLLLRFVEAEDDSGVLSGRREAAYDQAENHAKPDRR